MSHPENEESSTTAITNFKRRIAALQDENRALREGVDKRQSCVSPILLPSRFTDTSVTDDSVHVTRQTDKYITSGRAIRHLVSLADRVEDLVAEADHCVCKDGHQGEPTDERVFVINAFFVLMVF